MVGLLSWVKTRSSSISRSSRESVGDRGSSRRRWSRSGRGPRGYVVVGVDGGEDGSAGGRDFRRRDRGMEVRVHGLKRQKAGSLGKEINLDLCGERKQRYLLPREGRKGRGFSWSCKLDSRERQIGVEGDIFGDRDLLQ